MIAVVSNSVTSQIMLSSLDEVCGTNFNLYLADDGRDDAVQYRVILGVFQTEDEANDFIKKVGL